jgi:hypothetical protein
MGFYDAHPPVRNVVTKSAYFLRFGAPILSMVIFYFVILVYDAQALPTVRVFDRTFTIIHVFAIMLIIQIMRSYYVSRRMIRDEYIKKYGTTAHGVCDDVRRILGCTITVSFNGTKHTRNMVRQQCNGINIGDHVRIIYNPENSDDFVVLLQKTVST